MNQFVCLAFQVTLIICASLFCCCEATSIRLSPLGMVTVCPGGQILLTCERISGSILYWDFSVPHMAAIPQRVVLSQGDLLSPEFRIGFTEFNVTRTSDNPLTSQLVINNVTTEINGSTIYCSEDGDENNAPMTVINIKYKDEFLRSMDGSLNVTMVNQLLRSDDVTVTLQWPREPGAVYNVSVSPDVSHIESPSVEHNVFVINLTISYNIQYNVSIESSLCSVTTTKVLSYDSFLNFTMMNHFLRNSVTVTLQWSQEAGAVYNVNVSPLTELTNVTGNNIIMINLTISYNIQYNVSIASNLCDVTITRILKYVTCDLPAQLLHDPVVMVNGSKEIPYREGQFITYTCPTGLILTGSNASVCTENGEWEPDPGELACIADCGVPLVDRNVTLNYNSTLAGSRSVLVLTCESNIPVSIIRQIITVTCQSSGSWIPDPAQFTCSGTSLIPPVQTGSGTANLVAVFSSTIIIVCAISSILFLSIGYACGWFSQKHKKSRTSKAEDEKSSEGSQLPPTPGPLYEELQQRSTPEHQDLVELKENVAYGPIIK